MNKKGIDAGGIAVLIFIIAMFVVLYVLLLPPSEREQLLNITSNETRVSSSVEEGELIWFDEKCPCLFKPRESEVVPNKIVDVNLYIKAEPITQDLADSVIISRSLFGENSKSFSFDVENVDGVERVTLYFLVEEGEGNLIIELNGNVISNGKLTEGLKDINLPVKMLEKFNVIKFRVSSAFLGSNEYKLSKIKVRENYAVENTYAERSFVLTKGEAKNNAVLEYFISCTKSNRLTVQVNGVELFNDVYMCGNTHTEGISKDELKEGRNKLTFEIDKGEVKLTEIQLETKDEMGGVYEKKFSLTEEQFNDVIAGEKDVIVKLESSDMKLKKGEIEINGHGFSMETEDDIYERVISGFIKEKNNILKITPDTEFEIDNLEIKIE